MSNPDPPTPGSALPFHTVAYAWGYGEPSLPLFRAHAADSGMARQVATAHGWDPDRDGAWAVEMTLPVRRETALAALSSEARRDPTVEGYCIPETLDP